MEIMRSSLISALLALLLLCLFHPAAAQGCGSNWMGDTTGDPDFYVSRNQNLPTTGAVADSSSSSSSTALPLGRSARSNVDENATISSVKVDRPSPRIPGSAVVWMVDASSPGNEQILYDFLLKGPQTGGQFRDMTGWKAESSWIWNTTDADIGENQIEVLVTRQGAASFEDSRTLVYVIAPSEQNNESSETSEAAPSSPSEAQKALATNSDSGEVSVLGNQRAAPDESAQADLSIVGPNMRMPYTTPTPPVQPSTDEAGAEATEYQPPSETQAEPEEPQIMDVEGKWSIRLEDASVSLNPLRLIQTGESVMGMGTYNEGSLKIQVSADGSVGSNDMSLDVWTVVSEYGNQIDKRIKIELVKVERTVSGSYELYSGEELVGTGNATASRLAS